MKRLLPAVLVALFLHALMFYLLPTWTPIQHFPQVNRGPVTLTLSYRNSPKDQPSPPPMPLLQEKPQDNTFMRAQGPKVPRPKIRSKHPGSSAFSPKILNSFAPQRVVPPPLAPTPSPAPEPQAVFGDNMEDDFREGTPLVGTLPAPFPPPLLTQETKGTETPPPSPSLMEAVPLYRENPPPPYPGIARKRGQEGTVLIQALVDREGRVKDSRIQSSSGYSLLDTAAMRAVSRWRFEPGKRGNEPVEMWVTVPVRFCLK